MSWEARGMGGWKVGNHFNKQKLTQNQKIPKRHREPPNLSYFPAFPFGFNKPIMMNQKISSYSFLP